MMNSPSCVTNQSKFGICFPSLSFINFFVFDYHITVQKSFIIKVFLLIAYFFSIIFIILFFMIFYFFMIFISPFFLFDTTTLYIFTSIILIGVSKIKISFHFYNSTFRTQFQHFVFYNLVIHLINNLYLK